MRTIEIASNIGTSVAIKNPSRVLSQAHDLIKYATTGEGIKILKKCRGFNWVKRTIKMIY